VHDLARDADRRRAAVLAHHEHHLVVAIGAVIREVVRLRSSHAMVANLRLITKAYGLLWWTSTHFAGDTTLTLSVAHMKGFDSHFVCGLEQSICNMHPSGSAASGIAASAMQPQLEQVQERT